MIRLIRPDPQLLDAAVGSDDSLARILGVAIVPGWVIATAALERARDALAVDPERARWGTRFFIAEDPVEPGDRPELVGWGGFKGPPADRTVEIGYEIAESRRGRGLATAAARAMVAEAFGDETVTSVIAHTLREPNASNHILEKLGFRFETDAVDRGEPAWRFRLARIDAEPDRP